MQVETNIPIKWKTAMLKLRLCDYSDAFILAKRTKTITGAAALAATDDKIKGYIQKLPQFTNCISKVNNMQIDHARKTLMQ